MPTFTFPEDFDSVVWSVPFGNLAMTDVLTNEPPLLDWPKDGNSRVPYRAFADEGIHAAEQKRIFQGKTWQMLCLADEIPNPGDYKTTYAGETPVIVVRD